MTVSADSDYFGKESAGKSAKISVKDAEPGDIYTVYLPYDSTKGTTDSYLSTMLKASSSLAVEDGAGLVIAKDYKLDEEGQIEDPLTPEDVVISMMTGTIPVMAANGESDTWGHLSYPTRSTTKNEKRAVGITLVVLEKQDFTIRLDDTAVSKAGVLSRNFGKYDFSSGTSMAAPLVSGAVANTSWYYGKKDALSNRETVLGMTRTVKDLPVITRGVLDGRKLYYLDKELNLYVMDEEEQEFSRVSFMAREKAFAGIKRENWTGQISVCIQHRSTVTGLFMR